MPQRTAPSSSRLDRLALPGVGRVLIVHSPAPAAPRRRPPSPRAALLWGASLFVGFQLLLAASLERHLPYLRDPHYVDKAAILKKRLAEPGRGPAVVVLGSSRTVFGLRGLSAERALGGRTVVFNLGLPGAGPLTQLIALRRLLADGVRPDLLLVEVLPPVFAGQVTLPEVNRLAPERLWHHELALAERYVPGRPWRREWWGTWPVPCHTHRFALLSRLAPSLLHHQVRLDWFRATDAAGWVPPPWPAVTPERTRAAVAHTREEYRYYLQAFRLGGPSPRALRELLDVCRAERIPAALVLMPEGSDFRALYPAGAWAEIDGWLSGVTAEYGVRLVDARRWLPDDAFGDAHHATADGAERFSTRLANEVLAGMLSW